MVRQLVLPVAVVLLGAVGAHLAQRGADSARFADGDDDISLYDPRGEALRVAAMGSHTMLADTMWVRTVLRFDETFRDATPAKVQWFYRSLDATADLDPSWRTVYLYGGGFLRLFGEIDASDDLYRRGMENLPDDPFFPFSIGMNAYLHRDDPETAATFLAQAASMESAPAWYHAAAAAFLQDKGQRQAALKYIDEQLEAEPRQEVRESLQKKRQMLIHEELSDRLTAEMARVEQATGQPLRDPAQLGSLPPDPFGGQWIVAPDGVIRSDVEDAREALKVRREERAWLFRPGKPGFPHSPGF